MALIEEPSLAIPSAGLTFRVDAEAARKIPRAFAVANDVLAFFFDGAALHVAVPDSEDETLIDRITNVSGARVTAVAMPREAIRARLAALFEVEMGAGEERGDAPPAIRAVDDLHDAAIRAHASDIHLEPAEHGGRVRLRIDGILHERSNLGGELFVQAVSRIKLLAGMDIADRRQPQDGRYQIELHDRSIDARVSSMPTIAGEKLVVRMLDMRADVPTLERLGISPAILPAYRCALHAPHGFIVVCGPTGSGKTTTLYASLAERNLEGQHLCSVEDPVEIRMAGVAQVQVNVRAGLSFAAALRAFLRQDPNVIMVGEMRDAETASVAMSAALSGQLVITSLHASDAPTTVERLTELGLERRALAAGLSGILAQRLVRQLCERCRRLLADGTYGASACVACEGSGYRGRRAVTEYVPVTAEMRSAIASGAPAVVLRELAARAGYVPMHEEGLRLAAEGRTSMAELRRVLAVEPS